MRGRCGRGMRGLRGLRHADRVKLLVKSNVHAIYQHPMLSFTVIGLSVQSAKVSV